MPTYDWKCELCGTEELTVNPISQSDDTPPRKEGDTCEHKWKRSYTKAPQKAYGPGWNTRKGYH